MRARGGRRKANPPDFRRCPARPARVRRRFRPDFPRRGTGGYARRAHARNRLRRRNLRVPLPAHCTGWRGDSEAIRRQNYSDARNPGAHAQSGPDIREKPQAKPEALFLLMIAETPEKTWRMRRKARKPRHGNDRIHSKKRLARLRLPVGARRPGRRISNTRAGRRAAKSKSAYETASRSISSRFPALLKVRIERSLLNPISPKKINGNFKPGVIGTPPPEAENNLCPKKVIA